MNPVKPPAFYLILWALGLGVWFLGASDRLVWALLAFAFSVPAYFRKEAFHPGVFTVILGTSLIYFFQLFVLYGNAPRDFVAIYNLQYIQPLVSTLLILGLFQFYCQPSRQFDWHIFTLGLFLVFSTIDWQVSEYRFWYFWISLIWVLSWGMAKLQGVIFEPDLSLKMKKRITFQTFVLLFLAGGMTLGTVSLAEYIEKKYKDQLTEMLTPNTLDWSGFSGYTKLRGNREIKLSEDVALEIKTKVPREYLRGVALVHYKEGQWFPSSLGSRPFFYKGELPKTFTEKNGAAFATSLHISKAPLWEMIVTQKKAFEGRFFSPPNALIAYLKTSKAVLSNPYFNLKIKSSPEQEKTYVLAGQRLGGYQSNVTPELLRENLQIPSEVKAELLPLAKELTVQAKTPQEKAKAITAWFQKEFTYSLKIGDIPRERDPTSYFVLYKKPAYCSWFASGLTLMLRSLDIPAHVMSGWRNMEYHRLSGQWVVREKEAHNWVEVLDPQSGIWETFDPTPPGQFEAITGSGQGAGFWVQIKETVLFFFEKIQNFFQKATFAELLDQLQYAAIQLLSSAWFYLVLVVFLVLNNGMKRKQGKSPEGIKKDSLKYMGHEDLDSFTQRLQTHINSHCPELKFDVHLVTEMQALSTDKVLIDSLELWQALRFGPWDEAVFERLEEQEPQWTVSNPD